MEISFSQSETFTCPQCDTAFEAEVWMIVAITERSDLLEHIRNGTLHDLTCPECHQTIGQADAPLLVYCSGETALLFFSPAQQTTTEQDNNQAVVLIDILRNRLGEDWKDIWVEQGLAVIARSLLPSALSDDPQTSSHQAAEQRQQELEVLRTQDPETYQHIIQQSGQRNQQDLALFETLKELIVTPTWTDSYNYVKTHRELLSNEVDELLIKLIAQTQEDKDIVRIYEEHLLLLGRCREIGIEQAFAEKMKIAPEALTIIIILSQLPSDVQERVVKWEADGSVNLSFDEIEMLYETRPELREKLEMVIQEFAVATAVAHVSPELRDDTRQAFDTHYRYQVSGDLVLLEATITALENLLNNPSFEQAPKLLQLRTWDYAGQSFLARYWITGHLDDLEHAVCLSSKAVEQLAADSPEHRYLSALSTLGGALYIRYERLGQLEDLEHGIEIYQRAVQYSPTDSSDQALNFSNLGKALLGHYVRTQRLEDLEEAIKMCRSAVESTPANSPDMPNYLNTLGVGLRTRYERLGQLEDLERAIEASKKTVQLSPTNSPSLPLYITNLSLALQSSYECTGKLEDLEEAIRLSRLAVEYTPVSTSNLFEILTSLGNNLTRYYEHTKRQEDLENAIEIYRRAIQCAPPYALTLPTILTNLGEVLCARYELTQELEDLEQAIGAYQEAIQRTQVDSPELAKRLTSLGSSLHDHYNHVGRQEDLERAIETYQRAVQFTPIDSPHLYFRLTNLGVLLYARYERLGQLEDLECAIKTYQRAVQFTPIDSPHLPTLLGDLGISFNSRYERKGQQEDLEQAITIIERAASSISMDLSGLPTILSNLGGCLINRYHLMGRLEDLERAIEVLQEALHHASTKSSDQPLILVNLGNSLKDRYHLMGRLEDLERAIEVFQEALQYTSPHVHVRPGALSSLGNSLINRYEHMGKVEDLERAIEALQEAVRLTPSNSPSQFIYLDNLGVCLRARYRHTGRLEDLHRAVTAHQEVVQRASRDSYQRSIYLSNLGNVLRDLFGHTGRQEDLEQAIGAFREAVQHTSIDAPELPRHLNNLATGLYSYYKLTGRLEDLNEVIIVCQRVIQHTPIDSSELPARLSNFGGSLYTRYKLTGQLEDLKQAIEAHRAAEEGLPTNAVLLPTILNHLGTVMEAYYACTAELEHMQEAVSFYEKACQKGLEINITSVLQSACNWGDWAMERENWAEAIQAYTYGVQATEELYRTQLLRTSQETWLSKARGLHTKAAYTLARANHLREAVMMVEQGRARILSEILARDRADLARVQLEDQEAYDHYQQPVERLRQFERAEREGDLLNIGDRRARVIISPTEQIRQAREELEDAIARIRQIPGYEGFLATMTYNDISHAVQPDTPLVYVVTTPKGSLLLLIHFASDIPEAIWANDFTEEAMNDILVKYDGTANETVIGGYLPGQLFNPAWLRESLADALPQLGRKLIAPMFLRLSELGATGITLIPTGLLGLLPLHAAFCQLDGKEISLLEEFDVAYSPSARVLVSVQHETKKRLSTSTEISQKFVGISNPLPDLEVGVWAQGELRRVVPELQREINTYILKLRALAITRSPEVYEEILNSTALYEQSVRYLQTLCQEPSSNLIYAGRGLQRAAVLFAPLFDPPSNSISTLIHLAERIPPSLTYANVELENILKLLPAASATALYEHQATQEALWERLSQATVVHFACHGNFNREEPLDSALLLARETRLTLRDLLNTGQDHLAHLHLAFLSACQTAVTDFQHIPDEVVGLLSGFLQAGVPSVIGTLWSVDDLSTTLLVMRFYELYLHGDRPAGLQTSSPVRALRLAQFWLRDLTNTDLLVYLKNKTTANGLSPALLKEIRPIVRQSVRSGHGDVHPYADPYHWAAFVYYGAL